MDPIIITTRAASEEFNTYLPQERRTLEEVLREFRRPLHVDADGNYDDHIPRRWHEGVDYAVAAEIVRRATIENWDAWDIDGHSVLFRSSEALPEFWMISYKGLAEALARVAFADVPAPRTQRVVTYDWPDV